MLSSIVALALAAASHTPKPFTEVATVEGIAEYALPNGLKVLFVPDPSKPTVTVNLTVFVGSRHEGYGEKGMAHLFEHMLFKRTKKFESVKDELTKLGGWANGTTWLDRTNYFEMFPSDDAKLRRAVELEAERLRSAIISKEQLATEITVVRNEFEMGENRPSGVLEERLLSAAFLWHNYGRSTIGARSDIEKVPNDKLIAWYETYYQPDNAMLIVAGTFDRAKAFKAIADTFGKMPKPKRVLPATYTDEPTQDGERQLTLRRVGGTPLLQVGYHVPAATDPDYSAVSVLERLLGDSPGGRLHTDLVEAKKAAAIGCHGYMLKEPGYFICNADLIANEPTGPAKDALLATIEGFGKKPPTAQEVDRAKAAALKDVDLLLNDSTRIGIYLSEFASMGDWRMLFLARDRVEGVTPEDVARVAAKYLKPSNRTLGEYVPTEKPDRSEIPEAVNVAEVLKAYSGREALAAGEAFDASPANIDARTDRATLANGMKVALLAKKTRGETVRALIKLRYGTEKALENQRMAAELAAEMMLRGSRSRTRQQIKDALDQLKATVRVWADGQNVTAMVEVRKPQLAQTLDLLAECFKEPTFEAKEFEQLRREVISQAEQQQDDAMAIGWRMLSRIASPFPKGHILYEATWPETIAEAKAAKLEDVKAFHARFYGAQAGLASVVGDVDGASVKAQLTRHFGDWKAQQPFARIPRPFTAIEAKTTVIDTPDKAMAFYGSGLAFSLTDSNPDYVPMIMADYLLGGGFLNGRITKRLREQEGLSYGAGTNLSVASREDHSALMGYAIYAPQNVDRVEKGFAEELQKAVTGMFTDDELALAKEGLLKSREQERSEDMALAFTMTAQLDLGRTMAFEQAIDERLKKLTTAEVSAALKKYVEPKNLNIVKVGDFKKTPAVR